MVLRRHRKSFQRVSWLAIFALLLQTLVPLVHSPVSTALAGQLSFDDPKNICSAPDSEPAPSSNPSDSDKSSDLFSSCPVCIALHSIGGFVAPADIVLAIGHHYAMTFTPAPDESFVWRWNGSGAQARAPPRLT